jgi:hypothetical protein
MTHDDQKAAADQMLSQVTEWVKDASPSDDFQCHCVCCQIEQQRIDRDVGLEDVLLAEIHVVDTDHHPNNPFVRDQLYQNWTLRTLATWHLGKPLSEQSPDTIAFLHSLISS